LLSTGLAAYRTSGQLPFFRFRTGVVAEGTVERYAPQFSWATGPVAIVAEHMTADYPVLRDSASGTVRIQAWTATAGFMLTGERATLGAVSPATPVSRANGQWGAFEAVARVGAQSIGDEAFPVFADPAIAAREARSFGVGVNWYVNRHIKVMADYDHTKFTGGAIASTAGAGTDRPTEHALFGRMQLRF
jgi:phosphate-selective porin OprO/OprP